MTENWGVLGHVVKTNDLQTSRSNKVWNKRHSVGRVHICPRFLVPSSPRPLVPSGLSGKLFRTMAANWFLLVGLKLFSRLINFFSPPS